MEKLKFAVPTFVAVIGVVVVLRSFGVGPNLERGLMVDISAPTPYSLDHARVQARAGQAEEQPATF